METQRAFQWAVHVCWQETNSKRSLFEYASLDRLAHNVPGGNNFGACHLPATFLPAYLTSRAALGSIALAPPDHLCLFPGPRPRRVNPRSRHTSLIIPATSTQSLGRN